MSASPISRERLLALRASIPAVEGCRRGCSDCCGPAPVTDADAAQIATPFAFPELDGYRVTPVLPGCGTCRFASPAGCTIYAERPLVCRLFAAVDTPALTCPHGARAREPLTFEQSLAIVAEADGFELPPDPVGLLALAGFKVR